jgi:hypothetical protein
MGVLKEVESEELGPSWTGAVLMAYERFEYYLGPPVMAR